MSEPITVALLYGGKSGEHEISLISAASVLAHLNPARYRIVPIGMDKKGRCFLNDYEELAAHGSPLPVQTSHSTALPSLLVNGTFAVEADVIFPVVHGPLYEDGALQGLLQLSDNAYVGSGVLGSALGMDKDMARRIACDEHISHAKYHVLPWHVTGAELRQSCKELVDEYQWPLFVKPCAMGSSVGIHKVDSFDALLAAIEDARQFDEDILIEECLSGREIELAVLENNQVPGSPKVSIAGEIRVNHTDGFYSYQAKYLQSDKTELIVPAQIDDILQQRLGQAAADIFTRLKCKGMARVDFFIDEDKNKIYFNEINTLPGFTTISMYPKLWQACGINYPQLLEELIDNASLHYQRRQQLKTSY